MWRPMTRQARSVPVRLVSMIAFHSASGRSIVGVRLVRPAEFTRIWTPPNSAMAAASNFLMVDSSVTSQGVSSERRPRARISFAADLTRSSRRPVATTSAPARARPLAISRPMPLVPPMTIAALPFNSRWGCPTRFCSANQSKCVPILQQRRSKLAMRITDAKVIVCSPGRNFVTLKIKTEDGIYGLGDATLNGRELAVASYLSDHVIPILIGQDARRIEDIWQYLYKGAYWRRGPVTMTAIAAVDMALWDIKGKSLDAPVYQLLGGASRESVMVYGHASGQDVEATVKEVARYLSLGYKAIRAQSGIPGLKSTYGIAKSGAHHYEPAEKGAPVENEWSTELYLNFAPQLFARLRQEFGPEVHLLHDVHHRLTPIEAARLGKSLELYHLFWMEDPVPAELQESFRLIRQHTTIPIAVGEVFNTIFDCQRLIEEELIDYIRTSVVHAGGISHLRKIANLAELHHVKTGCHGATDLSPVCLAAALHFDLSVHNFGVQEYMPHAPETDRVFPHAYSFKDGAMYPGEKPGLGVDMDEALAAKYPYQRAYLPVNRKLDGTMHDW